MIPEPLPPLLRGLGTLLILLTSALVVTVERRDNAERAEQAHLARISLKAERSLQQGGADTDALAIELRLLRLQLQDNDLADEVFENPWFQWLGLLGTGLIAASFFAEWQLERSIARAARAVSPDG